MEELVINQPTAQALDAQVHTLLARVDKVETTIHARMDKMETIIQSLATQTTIPNSSHSFQGHLLPDAELGEFVADTVDTQGDLDDVMLVTLQLSGTNHFLRYVESEDATLPFGHFSFGETTLDTAKQNSRMQFLMETKDVVVTLRSAFFGELVGMQRHRNNGLDGFLATAVEEDATTALKAIRKDDTIRLVGPNKQHLRLITLITASGQPYDVLASKSILPEPQGLFTLTNI
jgi:hypothetical protein